jgi:hypothetical protein
MPGYVAALIGPFGSADRCLSLPALFTSRAQLLLDPGTGSHPQGASTAQKHLTRRHLTSGTSSAGRVLWNVMGLLPRPGACASTRPSVQHGALASLLTKNYPRGAGCDHENRTRTLSTTLDNGRCTGPAIFS